MQRSLKSPYQSCNSSSGKGYNANKYDEDGNISRRWVAIHKERPDDADFDPQRQEEEKPDHTNDD